MIYQLYCALVMAGYSAVGLLLGSYMMFYAEARELDLGYLFMIQPMTIFLRPLICAQADRYQSHKRLLSVFALVTCLAYLPFIVIPFLIADADIGRALTTRRRFWICAVSHLVGSVGFCGVRSLGDALAVNYAKRIGAAYARYRKYGAISFGVCGYLLGHINQHWLLPDFVPSFLVYSASFLTLAVLVYAWPDEYFRIVAQSHDDGQPGEAGELEGSKKRAGEVERQRRQLIAAEFSTGEQIVAHMSRKLCCCCYFCSPGETKAKNLREPAAAGKLSANGLGKGEEPASGSPLSVGQQARIFLLLFRRDFRIPLYLLTILYGGLVGYAGPNFVFTYMTKVCHERGTCNSSTLAGLVMISYCAVETLGYIIIDKFCARANRVLMLELTLVSLALHYYFYGFLLDHVSPYFFLVESLHGVEYSISLATSIDLGYDFGNQVEYLIPELIERGIISELDDRRLVKVSLMATMSGCCTLVYDGIGCILGSFIFGQITGHYSFVTTWLVIGSLASLGFVLVLAVYLLGQCLGVEPQILRLKRQCQARQLDSELSIGANKA